MTSGARIQVFHLFICLLVVVAITSVAEFVRVAYLQPHDPRPTVQQVRGIAFYRYKSRLKYEDASFQKDKAIRLTRASLTPAQHFFNETENPVLKNQDFMARHGKTQQQRKAHMQRICQTYYAGSPNIHDIFATYEKSRGSLLVDEKHKLLHCNTPKVAGTSWMRVLNVLTGKANSTRENSGYETVEVAQKIRRLASYTPSEIDHILKTYTKVMFSRHPFSRLLSAFSNKLAPNATDTKNQDIFRQAVGEIIQLMYHPCAYKRQRTRLSECKYNVSFHDFVRFLLDPTLDEYQSNVHWRSNYDICKPCVIEYDIIGKYETLVDDAKYVLKATKVEHLVSFPTKGGDSDTSTHSSDERKLITAYEQLSLHEIESLIRLYKMDFLLFDYPVALSDNFAQMLKHKTTNSPAKIKIS